MTPFFPSSPHKSLYTCNLLYRILPAYSDINGILDSCFSVPKSVCFAQGESTKITSNNPSQVGLIAKWTFDEPIIIDSSSHRNHTDQKFIHGPPAFGHGYSLHITSHINPLILPLSTPSAVRKFTVTFWLYLLSNTSLYFSNLISKGNNSSQTFTVLIYPDNRLSVRISTESDISQGISSHSRIPTLRWTFIAIAAGDDILEIYINGVLDNYLYLDSPPVSNDEYITVGPSAPSFEAYMDDLCVYNYKVQSHFISAQSNIALTGFTPKISPIVGCRKCKFSEVMGGNICPNGYTLCTRDDMFLYAAHVARVNGWLVGKDTVWHNDTPSHDTHEHEERMSLCCPQ